MEETSIHLKFYRVFDMISLNILVEAVKIWTGKTEHKMNEN